MKNIRPIFVLVIGSLLFLGACTYDFPEKPEVPQPQAGNADFSKFVAVGNSLTSGFMDGALYNDGQKNSFPIRMAESMRAVNPGLAFNQPDINAEKGANSSFPGFGRLAFIKPPCEKSNPGPRPIGLADPVTPYGGNKATLNNYGVPGMKVIEAGVGGYGLLNGLFGRFAVDPLTSSVLGDLAANNADASFFSMWLGSNDVLRYALSGGTGNPNGVGSNDMTPEAVFTAAYSAALNTMLGLKGGQAKGVVGNVPNVTDIPNVRVVNLSIKPFALDAPTATFLNAAFVMQGFNSPGFTAGSNNFFAIQTGPNTVKQMNPVEDFLLFSTPSDSLGTGTFINANSPICATANRAGWGVSKPIPNQFVLDKTEIALIQSRVAAFNTIIANAVATANANGIRVALVDINKFLGVMNTTGVTYGTTNINSKPSTFPFGNAFSLDGVHPNQKGYAVIANEFVKAINQAFGSTLPLADPNSYPGVTILP